MKKLIFGQQLFKFNFVFMICRSHTKLYSFSRPVEFSGTPCKNIYNYQMINM